MSRILHVPTRNIDDHWPRVRQGLERIITATGSAGGAASGTTGGTAGACVASL